MAKIAPAWRLLCPRPPPTNSARSPERSQSVLLYFIHPHVKMGSLFKTALAGHPFYNYEISLFAYTCMFARASPDAITTLQMLPRSDAVLHRRLHPPFPQFPYQAADHFNHASLLRLPLKKTRTYNHCNDYTVGWENPNTNVNLCRLLRLPVMFLWQGARLSGFS